MSAAFDVDLVRAAAFLAAGAVAGAPADAADVAASGFLAQRFEVNDNPDLDQEGGEARFASLTDVGVSFFVESPTSEFVFSPGVRLSAFTGSDSDVRLDPSLAAQWRRRGPRDDLAASLRVLPRFVEDDDFGDESGASDGDGDGDGYELVVGGDVGWRRRIDPRNSLSLNGFAEAREPLEGEDLTATRSYGVGAAWTHALNAATGLGLSSGFRRFESDDDAEETRDVFDVAVSADHAVNRRLSFGASAGPSFVLGDDGGVGLSAGLTAGYLYPDTRLSFAFDNAIDQDSDGGLDNVARISAGLTHEINARSRAGLTAGIALRTPFMDGDGDDERTVSIAPRYTRDITRTWSLSAGYTFRMRFDDDGEAVSNLVFISLSRALARAPAF